MKNMAIGYYNTGHGCSQCILKAAETAYGITLDDKIYKMVGTLNAGVGIGGMCAALTASVMVMGLLFDEEVAKKCRITFLSEFHCKYGTMDCGRLKSMRGALMDCKRIVYDAAELLEKISAAQKA